MLRQELTQVFGGADVNLHTAAAADFGQWPRPAPPPPPAPHGPYIQFADGTRDLAQIAAARNTPEQHLRALSEPAYALELPRRPLRSEEHTSELQSPDHL